MYNLNRKYQQILKRLKQKAPLTGELYTLYAHFDNFQHLFSLTPAQE